MALPAPRKPHANAQEVVQGLSTMAWYVALGVGLLAAFVRLVIYVAWCAPPIGLRARWATGRWIIPGYDRVFVVPLATVAVTMILYLALAALGCPMPIVAFSAVFVAVTLAMGMGPSLAEWRLTGEYRMVRHEPANPAMRGRRGAFASGTS
jgi:hypothetical protein